MTTPILAVNNVPSELIPIVAIVMTFAWLIVKALISPFVRPKEKPDKSGKSAATAAPEESAPSANEAAAIRQMQATLARMEARVEALETILIERTRIK